MFTPMSMTFERLCLSAYICTYSKSWRRDSQKSSMLDAFNFAKKASPGDDKHGPEYLELREFRLFMQTLVQHLEYLKAFSK